MKKIIFTDYKDNFDLKIYTLGGLRLEDLIDGKKSKIIRDKAKKNIADFLKKINSESNFNYIQKLLLYSNSILEQSHLKNNAWLNYIKITALDLNRDNISDATLTYKGSKKYLENFIYLLSCRWFLSYKIEKPSKLFYSLILKNNIKYKVPLFLQSLIYLIRFTINRIPLKKKNDPKWLREKNTLFIFSNFAHLDKKSGDLGKYYSKQWENLPEQLEKKGYRINWLHIFLKSSVIPNAKIGRNWIDKFNLDSEKQGYHAFLEQHLDWKIFLRLFMIGLGQTYFIILN